ncbi:MAG: 2-C-methyl-D-erythritol 4-phosphate cytidylyltransferase, partial [Lachnospiraceae bacterium]|nr:2-C-methyl-D-erythritol 4-phosphate cytidylyltransferase [Lachnospiraceae bacterium]
ELCLQHAVSFTQTIVHGGLTRFHSVRNALEKVPDGAIVSIHDGVRPLFTPGLVRAMLDRMQQSGGPQALIPAVPVTDTLRSTDPSLPAPDRSRLVAVQTPQMFLSEILKRAYEQPYDTAFTDDASVAERAGTRIELFPGEKYNLDGLSNAAVYQYLDKLPDESIVQRYRFIDSDDYVDMAKEYGRYLEEKYPGYMTLNASDETPVAIELVGAIDKVRQVLGIPVSRPLKLTSYKDASKIVEELANAGIGDLSVKYSAWCNDGVRQNLLNNVHTISELGRGSDLKKLTAKAKELGVDLYLDGVTQYEYDSNIFDGFFSFRDAARFLNKERAELYQYSMVTYAAREGAKSYYLLRADLAEKMAKNLIKATDKYGAEVSFSDIGMDVSSDFRRGKTYSREYNKNVDINLLRSADDSGKKIMINMGNDYAIPFVDFVTNMELKGSEYTLLDKMVPFYQIAIHGLVNYAGQPINICGNEEQEILTSAEYGASLYYTLMSESSFAIQKTLYPEYYGSEYAAWKDRLIETCKRYNPELGSTFGQRMTGHRTMGDVTCTEYEDGSKVYVNYSFTDSYKTPEGTVVPARDYALVK